MKSQLCLMFEEALGDSEFGSLNSQNLSESVSLVFQAKCSREQLSYYQPTSSRI
jgi:hypothetical protein